MTMETWKLPPPEKIYEAFSVLADNRCTMTENKATIISSDSTKKYLVEWSVTDDGATVIRSDDNASRWQGYTGYPIIAVLMITGKLTVNQDIIKYFKNIPWNALNKAANRNYSRVVGDILDSLNDKELAIRISKEADHVFSQLSALHLFKPSPKKKS
jgi:hypothetical protein